MISGASSSSNSRHIQRLTQTGGMLKSLVRLTAHYHGLLQAWTEI